MAYDCKAIAAERFAHGDRRSAVYQEGFLDALMQRLNGTPRPDMRYAEGSVERDAYWAGWDHGCHAARDLKEGVKL